MQLLDVPAKNNITRHHTTPPIYLALEGFVPSSTINSHQSQLIDPQ
jgi:hypothetical protein